MSVHADNLGRAARLLKRLADIGGPGEFEGVALSEIVGDILTAQSRAYMTEAFVCNVDESAGQALPPLVEGFSPPRTWGPSGDAGASSAARRSDDAAGAEIHDLHDFSKKVG